MIIEATADGRKVMIETDRIQYIANNDGKADVKGDDFILRFDDYEEVRHQVMKEHYTTIEMLEKAEKEIGDHIKAFYNAARESKNRHDGLFKAVCDGEERACESIMYTVTRVFKELKE
jgi:hypothetical protein